MVNFEIVVESIKSTRRRTLTTDGDETANPKATLSSRKKRRLTEDEKQQRLEDKARKEREKIEKEEKRLAEKVGIEGL